MVESTAEWQQYIESRASSELASQLRRDQELCQQGKLPSLLAHHLPLATSAIGDAISRELLPHSGGYYDGDYGLKTVRHLQYDGVVHSIKAYLSHMDSFRHKQHERHEDADHYSFKALDNTPTTAEFESALKVLHYLAEESSLTGVTSSTTLQDLKTAVQTQLSLDPARRAAFKSYKQPSRRKCYICRLRLTECHELYPALCRACGDFNLAKSKLSLPENLDLKGITALVTGGRINLGFHTALRLLRCGANVIVSTRYPRDAETRYRDESDSDRWTARLKVVGADFRSANDAFRLVAVVRDLLHSQGWKLNVLINNAAQTLTDPLGAESNAVSREHTLRGQPGNGQLLINDDKGYDPRVRGGVQMTLATGLEGYNQLRIGASDGSSVSKHSDKPPQKGLHGEEDKDGSTNGRSSWSQSMNEIPYEDMISAHSVNAFVPLILCRELLPLMGTAGDLLSSSHEEQKQEPGPETTADAAIGRQPKARPHGYIVNVSSREGLFEDKRKHSHKSGQHVHTNMSKAAINMITETESSPAWRKHRIAMNTVDPGYMSAAPESYRPDEGCPIGFDDGAARVLWPLVAGLSDGVPVWGRFLKHFGASDVEVGLGRGVS